MYGAGALRLLSRKPQVGRRVIAQWTEAMAAKPRREETAFMMPWMQILVFDILSIVFKLFQNMPGDNGDENEWMLWGLRMPALNEENGVEHVIPRTP